MRRFIPWIIVIATLVIIVYVAYGLPNSNGEKLAYLRFTESSTDLWLADADGSKRILLQYGVTAYSVTSDGHGLVYSQQNPGQLARLEILDLHSYEARILAASNEWSVYNPVIAPFSEPLLIAYERRAVEGEHAEEDHVEGVQIWLIDATGTDKGPIQAEANASNFNAKWSPNGRYLAFQDNIQERIGLYSPTGEMSFVPLWGDYTWSPDSTQLIVAHSETGRANQHSQLIQYSIQTAQQKALFSTQETSDTSGVWSPDGKQLAFIRYSRDRNGFGSLWVGNLETGDQYEIDTQENVINMLPTWSQDSQYLLWNRLNLEDQNSVLIKAAADASSKPSILVDDALHGVWFSQTP